MLGRLDVEDTDLAIEREALAASRHAAEDARSQALAALDDARHTVAACWQATFGLELELEE